MVLKAFQTGFCQLSKDHEVNGRWHKHICVFCLTPNRFLAHPEEERKKSFFQQMCASKTRQRLLSTEVGEHRKRFNVQICTE